MTELDNSATERNLEPTPSSGSLVDRHGHPTPVTLCAQWHRIGHLVPYSLAEIGVLSDPSTPLILAARRSCQAAERRACEERRAEGEP